MARGSSGGGGCLLFFLGGLVIVGLLSSSFWPLGVALLVAAAGFGLWWYVDDRRTTTQIQARAAADQRERTQLQATGRTRGDNGALRLYGPPLLLKYERTRLDPAGHRPVPSPSSLWLPQPPDRHLEPKGQTDAEASLWRHLQRNAPVIWVAQHHAGDIRLDFVSLEAGIVVEVDDPRHFENDQEIADAQRDAALIARGFRVIRYTNPACSRHPDDVATRINAEARTRLAAIAAGTLAAPQLDPKPYANTRRAAQQAPRASTPSSSSKAELVAAAIKEAAARSADGTFTHADVWAVITANGHVGQVSQSTSRTYLAAMLNADSDHCITPVVRRVSHGKYRLAGS